MKFLKKIGIEPFILCLLGAIFIAWLDPAVGMDREPFSLGDAANWGVCFIFFFYGLRLDRAKLKEGLVNTRLHVLIHLSTFVMFPAVVYAAMCAFGGFEAKGTAHFLWIGAFFLASLPSTVSSSVVMVSIARGNMPAAIFNASLSSMLGVFMTPILMGLILEQSHGASGLGEVIIKLILQVILPVGLGLYLNPKYGGFARAHKRMLRIFDQTVIVLIVYTSFCDSFAKKMFEGFSILEIFALLGEMTGLFVFAMLAVWGICRLLKFNREDTITAVFCGSKKSLAHASVMSRVLFENAAAVGVILLPTMIYHAMQLVLVSAIAKRLGREEPRV